MADPFAAPADTELPIEQEATMQPSEAVDGESGTELQGEGLEDDLMEQDSELAPKRQRRRAPGDARVAEDSINGIDAAEAAAGALAEAAAGSVLDVMGEESVIARLRGLPWSYGPQDVCDFLSKVGVTLQPETVTMLHNAAGEAFVTLETSAQLAEVVKANRQQVGRRYVEVFASTAAEKLTACERNRATMREDAGYRGVLRMRGLPFTATIEEVLDFFGRTSALQPSNVHLMRKSDGRSSGDAYAVFDTEEAAVDALKFDKKKLGTRWVDLFQSSKGELYSLTSLGGIMQATSDLAVGGETGSEPAMHALGEGYSVVKLRGLPWNVTNDDIITFLSGIQVPAGGIHLMNGANGRPSGLAYVELNSEEDQTESVKRDKQSIGGRYIDVFACTQNELQARLAGGLERGMGAANSAADQLFVKLRGLPYSATDQQIAQFFTPLQVIAVQVAYNQQGQPSGFGFVQFRSPDDAAAAGQRSNQVLGSRYVEVFRCIRQEMEQARMHAMSVLPKQWHHGAMPVPMNLDPSFSPKGHQGGGGRRQQGQGQESAYSAYQAALQTLASRPAAAYPQNMSYGAPGAYGAGDPNFAATHNGAAYSNSAAYSASYGNSEVAYSNGAVPGAVSGAGYAQDSAGYGQGGSGYPPGSYTQGAGGTQYTAPAAAGYGAAGGTGAAPNYHPQGYSAADYGYSNWYYGHQCG